ncbi:hypothetical protein [Selenomonas sp. oral taxon 136]|uniref:hypothetical protein n=1 Tax=Selenomonas sp. oral taxon 136 TaxID=713030 RepID=UPI00076842E6|nr:hypothetical protein [Selenomonas sp. oral taxon 136]AME02689.1 hypothetical protein AXE86_00505 [Selenomonas sp. oral taxon 136]
MKGKWFVEECFCYSGDGPSHWYQVIRLVDPAKAKNKEYAGIYRKKSEANAEAKRLNSEDTP